MTSANQRLCAEETCCGDATRRGDFSRTTWGPRRDFDGVAEHQTRNRIHCRDRKNHQFANNCVPCCGTERGAALLVGWRSNPVKHRQRPSSPSRGKENSSGVTATRTLTSNPKKVMLPAIRPSSFLREGMLRSFFLFIRPTPVPAEPGDRKERSVPRNGPRTTR